MKGPKGGELFEEIAQQLVEHPEVIEKLQSGETDGVAIGKEIGVLLHAKWGKSGIQSFTRLDQAETARKLKPVPDNWIVKQMKQDRFVLVGKPKEERKDLFPKTEEPRKEE